jgi:hypothetical protein
LGDARGVLAGLGSQVMCMAPAEGSKVLLASSGAITNVDAPEC